MCQNSDTVKHCVKPSQFSKRGGLTGPQFLEGVAGKEGGDFFQGGGGGCNF